MPNPKHKHITCGSVVPGCPWHAEAATEAELLAKVAEHAKTEHGVAEVSPELLAKVKDAIQEH